MRNLQEYPITKDEIITYLEFLTQELSYEKTGEIGSMGPLLLAKAKEIINGLATLP